MSFEEDIRAVINSHNQENLSNTPDFILACYLVECMNSFDMAVSRREEWYGREIIDGNSQQVKPCNKE